MKTIKSFGIILMLTILGIGFDSCSKEYESRLPELLIKNLEFDSNADTQVMEFRNEDLTNYGVSTDAEWCDAWIDYDLSTINVKVRERGKTPDEDPYSDRTCTVTVNDVRDKTVRTFQVKQKQTNDVIVNENKYTVPSGGGDVNVEVQHNVSYQVVIPEDVTWITEKKASTRGLETSTVVLTVAANTDGGARSSTVTIKSVDGSIENTILIQQVFEPVYSVEKETVTIDELAQTIQIKFSANFKMDFYPSEDWVTSAGRETVDETNYIQNVRVSAFNDKKENRTATLDFYANVKLSDQNYKEIKQSVILIQERTLYIPKDTLELFVGDSAVVEVVNKNKLDLVWSSSDDSEFSVDQKGKVKALRDDGDKRAHIKVASKDGKYSDEILALIKTPEDMTKYLSCKWKTIEDVTGTDTTYVISCTMSMAEKGPDILVKKCSFYNDSTVMKSSSWGDGEVLSAEGSISMPSSISLAKAKVKNYYVDWDYTYAKDDYTLRFSMDGKITIKKHEKASSTTTTTTSAATRRSSRRR